MKATFSKIENNFIRFIELIIILLTISLFIIVGFNVIRRYVFNNSLAWADELSRYIFVWTSLLAAMLAYKNNEHIGLDLLVSRIRSPKIKGVLKIISEFFILIILVILLLYGRIVAISATNVSPAIGIPIKFFYMIIPFTATLMVIINLRNIVRESIFLFKRQKSLSDS